MSSERSKHHSSLAMLRKKAKLTELKSGPCMDCGQVFPPYVMDLHHRDPSTKLRAVSKCAIADMADEAAKCDLLCSNCHRIRHHSDTYGHNHKEQLETALALEAEARAAREAHEHTVWLQRFTPVIAPPDQDDDDIQCPCNGLGCVRCRMYDGSPSVGHNVYHCHCESCRYYRRTTTTKDEA